MRDGIMAVGVIFGLAACSAQKPQGPPQLMLQPILYFDVTQNKLFGAGCNFVASDGGMGAVFLAQDNRGLIKIDDHIVTIPVAADAAPLPQSGHTHYAGPLYSATLVPEPGGRRKTMGLVEVFAGHLTITDARRQPVYDAHGDAQCKPM